MMLATAMITAFMSLTDALGNHERPMNDGTTDSVRSKLLRWTGCDYHTPAVYFVTICTADRRPLLSYVDGTGRLHPSRTGLCVSDAWYALPDRLSSLDLIAFVVMPDRVHGVLEIRPAQDDQESLAPGRVISVFKSISNHAVRQIDERTNASGSIWQKGYHDRVVRSDDELRQIEWYVTDNPARWAAARMASSGVDTERDLA